MSPENLCYWLRGALDCKNQPSDASYLAWQKKFLQQLKQALPDVKTSRYTDEHLSVFVIWLEAAIEFGASVEKIEARVNNLFKVVINPKIKNDKYDPGNLRAEDYYNK